MDFISLYFIQSTSKKAPSQYNKNAVVHEFLHYTKLDKSKEDIDFIMEVDVKWLLSSIFCGRSTFSLST